MSRTNFNYKFYSSTNFLKLKFLYKKKRNKKHMSCTNFNYKF